MITALLSQELDSSQLKELQAALKGFVQKNETLKIETKVSKPPLALAGGKLERIYKVSQYCFLR